MAHGEVDTGEMDDATPCDNRNIESELSLADVKVKLTEEKNLETDILQNQVFLFDGVEYTVDMILTVRVHGGHDPGS